MSANLFDNLFRGEHKEPIGIKVVLELLNDLHEVQRDAALKSLIQTAQSDVDQGNNRYPKCHDDFCMRSLVIQVIKTDRATQLKQIGRMVTSQIHAGVTSTLQSFLAPTVEHAVSEAQNLDAATIKCAITSAVNEALDERAKNAWYRRVFRTIVNYIDLRKKA